MLNPAQAGGPWSACLVSGERQVLSQKVSPGLRLASESAQGPEQGGGPCEHTRQGVSWGEIWGLSLLG